MAAGLPVVCLNKGGPALSVTDETGIRVEARRPSQVVRELADALVLLAGDPELRLRMGHAGQERIRESFQWSQKAKTINLFYERALESAR
jgi:glycosyltransferase involved in cell wall biosynthesis